MPRKSSAEPLGAIQADLTDLRNRRLILIDVIRSLERYVKLAEDRRRPPQPVGFHSKRRLARAS
jgi:hypothetical protein